MTRWMFPYIGFMSMVALSAGVLNTWKRFAVPAMTPVLLNLAMIAAAWWGAPWFGAMGVQPIYAMAGGVMLGGLPSLAIPSMGLVAAIYALCGMALLADTSSFTFRRWLVLSSVLAAGSYVVFIELLKLTLPVWPEFISNY